MLELDVDTVQMNDLVEAVVSQMVQDPDAKRDRRREHALKAIATLQEKGRVALADGAVVLL